MHINVSNLSQGVHTFLLEAAPVDIEIQQHYSSVIKAEVTLEKGPHQMVLDVRIPRIQGCFVCDRCVEQFTKDILCSYRKVYVTRDVDASGIDQDDIEVMPPDRNIIDLSEDVRDALILAIPLKNLCREDCAGLCTRCGKNLNTGQCDCDPAPPDSRWETLEHLRDK